MATSTRRIPRQRRQTRQVRPGRVYLILTRPVDTAGRVAPGQPPEVGYIGQTRQQVSQRAAQHRADQPFSDLIVDVLLLDQGVWTDAQLDAREQMWIQTGVSVGVRVAQRPRYNHDHNLGNPGRVEVWRAVEHRRTREPGWQPPQKGRIPRQWRHPARGPRVCSTAGWWRLHRWRVYGWAALWLLLCAVMWLAGAETWSGWDEPRSAVVSGSCAWAAVVWWVRRQRPKRRRRGRRR